MQINHNTDWTPLASQNGIYSPSPISSENVKEGEAPSLELFNLQEEGWHVQDYDLPLTLEKKTGSNPTEVTYSLIPIPGNSQFNKIKNFTRRLCINSEPHKEIVDALKNALKKAILLPGDYDYLMQICENTFNDSEKYGLTLGDVRDTMSWCRQLCTGGIDLTTRATAFSPVLATALTPEQDIAESVLSHLHAHGTTLNNARVDSNMRSFIEVNLQGRTRPLATSEACLPTEEVRTDEEITDVLNTPFEKNKDFIESRPLLHEQNITEHDERSYVVDNDSTETNYAPYDPDANLAIAYPMSSWDKDLELNELNKNRPNIKHVTNEEMRYIQTERSSDPPSNTISIK